MEQEIKKESDEGLPEKKELKLIICVVNRGFAEEVMDAARAVGAGGGTVLHGRGTSNVTQTIFGMRIEPEKEILLLVVRRDCCRVVMESISDHAGLNTPGSGICFALPVEDVVGMRMPEELMKELRQAAENADKEKKADQ